MMISMIHFHIKEIQIMAANGLITDLYQLTMANALFKKGMH